MRRVGFFTAAGLLAAAFGQPALAQCDLGNGIKHVVYIQFDNVHFRRDNPNVPSDLKQVPNLLKFLEGNGAFLTKHWTPLISHTAVDILTSLTGVYGDKFGVPIGNSFRYFNPNGTSTGAGSFAYWTDPLDSFDANPTDTTPELIDQHGNVHPALWVPFTRAGCDVGAFSIANIELENTGLDIETVFGANSPEAAEAAAAAKAYSTKAIADFEGIAIHCAKGSPLCATHSRPDLLPQEAGAYIGYSALFGNVNVQPQISLDGPVKDLDRNVVQDSDGNVGFPGFSPSASQTLGYLATMLEKGVPVVYSYIADAHDDHVNDVAFGPGQAGYVAQLKAYNDAFGKFFARLKADGITTSRSKPFCTWLPPIRSEPPISSCSPIPTIFCRRGKTAHCVPLDNCSQEGPGFAWNHGDFQPEITNTWLGIVGPGVEKIGVTGSFFTDHADIRPTIISLVGLTDDYAHDGRVPCAVRAARQHLQGDQRALRHSRNEKDWSTLRAGLRLAREIGEKAPLAPFTAAEIAPGPDGWSDDALDTHIRATAITVHHPLGTCKMGRDGDPLAVVDRELRVFGVDALRIVDALVMPDLVGGNINAPIIMIAEKAADMIRGRTPLAPVNV